RETRSDLPRQQKWRKRPQFVDHEYPGKDLKKLATQILQVEHSSRKQIQAYRNADGRRYDQHDSCRRMAKRTVEQIQSCRHPPQSRDVEAQVHDLDEKKQNTHVQTG